MTDDQRATRCYICGHANQQSLEEHHLVPRRLNGSDSPENTVYLCGSCHNAIESLYDDEFYHRLGIAVDGIDDDRFVNRNLGVEINANESIDREIPKRSEHVEYEEWRTTIFVSEIRDESKINTHYADSIDKRTREFVSDNRDDIISRYEDELDCAQDPRDYWDNATEWYDGSVPPVKFSYRHGSLKVPSFVITNRHENGVDYESREEFIGEKPIVENSINTTERIHCGYCHTAFLDVQQSDMARHLRIRHGVENPWTIKDSTFSNTESGMHDLMGEFQ